MTLIKFHEKAYCKMALHSVKYPHCAVNGVLLAKTTSLNNANKEIEFVDAIPLFHTCINLTPMAEIALMQIDEYASRKGLTIVGYYGAPEIIRDSSFEKIHNRISEKIASNCNPTYIVLVNSTISSIQMGKVAVKIAQYVDGSYKAYDHMAVSEDAINVSINLLENSFYKKLIDFDNHLDNISLDWRNETLNTDIENLL